MRPILFLVRLLLLYSIVLSFGTSHGTAQTDDPSPRLLVNPQAVDSSSSVDTGYFVFTLEPGAQGVGNVHLANPGSESILVDLSVVNARTSTNGGSSFHTADEAPTGVSTWVSYDEQSVALDAGAERLIEFSVQTPKDVAPGQYLAGLSMQIPQMGSLATPQAIENQDQNQATAAFNIKTRYVIAVVIEVPGEWEASLQIRDAQLAETPSSFSLQVGLENDGTTFLRPEGAVVVTDADGNIVLDSPIKMGVFITGTESSLVIPWPGTPNPGLYSVAVDLRFGNDGAATYSAQLQIGAVDTPALAIRIDSMTVTPMRSSDGVELQYVDIVTVVDNPGQSIKKGSVALEVYRDGELIEAILMGSDLTFPQGEARFQQRYLPPSGWVPGTYTFILTISHTNEATGETTALSSFDNADPIVVD